MFKPSQLPSLVLGAALVASACGNPASEATAAPVNAAVPGTLTEASYKEAAGKALAQGRAAMSDRALTEEKLDTAAASIERLLPLAQKLKVDQTKLDDAELMSTLGALYTRKAGFHATSAQQAGIYSAKGFRYLDRAVAKYPDNLAARINRGMTSAKVPEFMNKSAVARDDLRFVTNHPDFATLPAPLQASVRAALADVERRMAQAGQS